MIFLDMFVNKLWDSHELESFPIKQLLLKVNEKLLFFLFLFRYLAVLFPIDILNFFSITNNEKLLMSELL